MTKFKKGQVPWNKGKKISEKTRKKLSNIDLKDMQKLAKDRGGECLSEEYLNMRKKLRWKCKENHIWMAPPNTVKYRNTWCPVCADSRRGDYNRLNIIDMQKLAKSRGGKCLSNKYKNNSTKLKWKCKDKHIWEAIPNSVIRGSWCPKCSEGISERICRKYFEEIFDKKFPKIKPKWLKSRTGKILELDGYCKELGLAFEYQGIQHYSQHELFNKKEDFDLRKKLDQIKRDSCRERGIVLIEVPYTIKFEEMDKFIINECKKNRIMVPKITKSLDHRLFDIYSPEKLKEMQEIAKSRGGLCLSKKFINAKTKLKWRCKEGHVWYAIPSNVKFSQWCPYCSHHIKVTIKNAQKLANAKGGECLSKKYVGPHSKLKWKCERGHTWETVYNHVNAGHWCPHCAWIKKGKKKRLTKEEMEELARKKGGKCLSKEYFGAHKKLKWQCDKNHIWRATPNHIKNSKTWCPQCYQYNRSNKKP